VQPKPTRLSDRSLACIRLDRIAREEGGLAQQCWLPVARGFPPRPSTSTAAATHDRYRASASARHLHRRGRVQPRLVKLLLDTNVLVAALISRGTRSDPLGALRSSQRRDVSSTADRRASRCPDSKVPPASPRSSPPEPVEHTPMRREVFEDPQVRASAHDRSEQALSIGRQCEAQAGVGRRPEIEVRA